MPGRRWFYELLSQEFGPVTAEQVDDLVDDGTLAVSDRVRPEDSDSWISIQRMRDTIGDGDSSAAPEDLSDLSELSFSFEENTDTGTARDALDIDAFSIEGDSDSAYAESPAAVRRRQKHTAIPEDDDEPEEMYFVESLGEVLGPMPMRELMQMAEDGVLSATDKVRYSDSEDWYPADALPEIAAAFINLISDSDDPLPKRVAPQPDPERTQNSPAKAKAARPKKKATSKAAAAGRPTKKKKKRKKKEDEFLKEIFSEVFTEDGTVKAEHQPGQPAPPTTTVAAAAPAATGADATTQPATPVASPPLTPAPPAPAVAPAAGATAAAAAFASTAPGFGGAAAGQPAAARPPYPPPTKKKKRRGAGFSMPMIDVKVLGVIGGVLLLGGVIVAGVMGYIPLPGFGVDPKAVALELYKEYESMASGAITADQWKAFAEKAQPLVRQANRQLGNKGGAMTPEDFKIRGACQRLGMLVATDFSNEEAREISWAAVQKAMAGIR